MADLAAEFARKGYALFPGLIEPALTAFLQSYVDTKFASRMLTLGDQLAPTTLNLYGDPAFDGLMEFLRPRLEPAFGCKLYPTYSYFRLYKRGDALPPHRDRPACELSVSLNLAHVAAEPWPLVIEGEAGPFEARFGPGDALLYRGHALRHWRESFAGERSLQVFLHYVDRNGPNAGQRFDGRQTLMRPLGRGAVEAEP